MKNILIGRVGIEPYYLAKETDGWIGFTQKLSARVILVNSIEEGLKFCKKDEISGLKFSLGEVVEISTIKNLKIIYPE